MIWRDLAAGEAESLAAQLVEIDPFLRLGYQAAQLLNYFTRPDPALDRMAIESEGTLSGILCRRRPWLRGPLIETLALLPAATRQWQGSAVQRRCKAEAGANLWATVAAFHQPARRFYQRAGFVEVAGLDGLIRPDQNEILLRWRGQTAP
jgi:GNAT superfamily N-acetyltransferase